MTTKLCGDSEVSFYSFSNLSKFNKKYDVARLLSLQNLHLAGANYVF